MKKLSVWAVVALMSAPAWASDVGVSVRIGDPNFFGHIEIGNAPPPRVIYKAPVVVDRTRVVHEPIYLRVPPGHSRRWREYCHEYSACGRPVYFVRDDWYRRSYVPHYREHHDYYERRQHRREYNENRREHRHRHHHDHD